jgi:diamine N-acetyltransferase
MADTESAHVAPGLEIRPARPGEAGLVLALVRELADYERLAHEVDATEAMIEAALFGPNPRLFCDLAIRDGEPIGFALWFYNYSSFRGRHGLYLEDLFVRPAHRGRGIGKALLVRLARRCRDEGLARFEWAVLDWNAPSIAFYESLGARAMDEWTIFRLSGEALARLAAKE